jgi:hypothetical protein
MRKSINKKQLPVAVLAAGLFLWIAAGQALGTPFPGPDDFGYTARDITFNLRDISRRGRLVSLGDDQVSGAIGLPFDFNFYGVYYNEVYISSNGFISFDAGVGDGCCSVQPLPQDDFVNNVVAGYWEDLNPRRGKIRYQTLWVEDSREFVIGFYDVPHYVPYLSESDGDPVTFEIILHEGTNHIELQYGEAPSDGGTHSAGIENADGTIGLQVAYGDVSFEYQGFLLKPEPLPLVKIKKEITRGPDELPAPTSITFETLSTSCTSPPDTFKFFLNEVLLGSLNADTAITCDCLIPLDTLEITDAELIASTWKPGGNNNFRFVKVGNRTALRWVRAQLERLESNGWSKTVCIYDFDGSPCDVMDLCNPYYWFSFLDLTTGIGDIDVVVEVAQDSPTEFNFDITYSNPERLAVLIEDTVPAEWNVTAVAGNPIVRGSSRGPQPDNNGGTVEVFKAGKGAAKKESATKIHWWPDPDLDLSTINVVVETRQSPDKKNGKFLPASCGALFLNHGAAVFAIDPATDQPLADPNTGERLPPLLDSNNLCLSAVEDVNGGGIIPDGSGDEDDDGLTDFHEACEIGTDPCNDDTDGDGARDGQD